MPIPSETQPTPRPPSGAEKARIAISGAHRRHPGPVYLVAVTAVVVVMSFLLVDTRQAVWGCVLYAYGAINLFIALGYGKGR